MPKLRSLGLIVVSLIACGCGNAVVQTAIVPRETAPSNCIFEVKRLSDGAVSQMTLSPGATNAMGLSPRMFTVEAFMARIECPASGFRFEFEKFELNSGVAERSQFVDLGRVNFHTGRIEER